MEERQFRNRFGGTTGSLLGAAGSSALADGGGTGGYSALAGGAQQRAAFNANPAASSSWLDRTAPSPQEYAPIGGAFTSLLKADAPAPRGVSFAALPADDRSASALGAGNGILSSSAAAAFPSLNRILSVTQPTFARAASSPHGAGGNDRSFSSLGGGGLARPPTLFGAVPSPTAGAYNHNNSAFSGFGSGGGGGAAQSVARITSRALPAVTSTRDELTLFGDDALIDGEDDDESDAHHGGRPHAAGAGGAAPPRKKIAFAEIDAATAELEMQRLEANDPVKIAERAALALQQQQQAGVDRATIELIREQMHERLSKYKTRLDASQAEVQRARDETKKLRDVLKEIEREKIEEKENERRAKLMSTSKRGAQSLADRAKYLELQRAERLKRLMKDIDDLSKKNENSEGALGHTRRHAQGGWCAQFAQSASMWITTNTPLSRDVKLIEARFGSGMSSFFDFFQFTFLNSILLMPVHIYLLVHQCIAYINTISTVVTIVPKWTLYSSFNDTSFAYAGALAYAVVYLLFVAMNKWVRSDGKEKMETIGEGDADSLLDDVGGGADEAGGGEEGGGDGESADAAKRKLKSKARAAASLFNLWDFGLEEQDACEDARASMVANLQLLISEQTVEERLAARTQSEKIVLGVRRTLGVFFNLVFVLASWGVIVFAALYQTTVIAWVSSNVPSMGAVASYLSPLITSVINAAIKPVTFALVNFEQWDDAATVLKHQTSRLYIGKQANIFISVASLFLIAQQTSVFGLSVAFDATVYTCAQDYVGVSLFKLMLTEFFLSKVITVGVFTAKWIAQKTCVRGMKQEEFSISSQMNDLLYFQLLVWITLPLFPFGCIVGNVMLYLNFKFDVLRLTMMSAKTSQVFSARDMGSFFTFFYTVTGLATVCLIVYFLNSAYPCASGPFSAAAAYTPWTYVQLQSSAYNLSILYNIFSSPLLYVTLWLLFMLRFGLNGNSVEALQTGLIKERKLSAIEIARLQADLAKKERALEQQKKAAQL